MKRYIYMLAAIMMCASPILAQDFTEIPQPNSPKIVIKFMFKNGSVTDPKSKEGLTSLVTDLMIQGGTGEKSAKDIKNTSKPMAASYDASTDKEVSVFTFEVHKDFLEVFYPIITGLVTKPSFSEEDFSRVKSNQQNYVDQVIRASSDEEYSKKALEDLLYRGTPYQHVTQGTSDGVKSITLADAKAHFANFYGRSNLSVGLIGSYPATLVARLKKDLSVLPEKAKAQPMNIQPNTPKGIQVEIITKANTLGSAIFGGYKIDVNRSRPDWAALMVANSYMGEHRKSYGKLYQKIREQRSMNYGDYTYIEWYDNGGSNMLPATGIPRTSNYFGLWIRPVQTAAALHGQYPELKDITIGHAHFAIRMAMYEIGNLVKNGMSKEDFEITRTFLRSYIKLYPQNTGGQLGFMMDSKFYNRKNYLKEMDTELAKLTVADVNAAVKKYMQTDNMFITIVTDESEAEPLKASLMANSPSPMSYSNALKAVLAPSILAEDEIVAKVPLKVTSVKIIKSEDTFK